MKESRMESVMADAEKSYRQEITSEREQVEELMSALEAALEELDQLEGHAFRIRTEVGQVITQLGLRAKSLF